MRRKGLCILLFITPFALLPIACGGDEDSDSAPDASHHDATSDAQMSDRTADRIPYDAPDEDSGDHADGDAAAARDRTGDPCYPGCAPDGFCNLYRTYLPDGGLLEPGCHPWPSACAPGGADVVCDCLKEVLGNWCGGHAGDVCEQGDFGVEISCFYPP